MKAQRCCMSKKPSSSSSSLLLCPSLPPLLLDIIRYILLAIVVRCNLHQPCWLYLRYISHKLLTGWHQLVVHNPSGWRLHLSQSWSRMDPHRLRVLHGPVRSVFLQFGCVVEEPSEDGLFDSIVVACVGGDGDLHPLHETEELLADVAGTFHGANLRGRGGMAVKSGQTTNAKCQLSVHMLQALMPS